MDGRRVAGAGLAWLLGQTVYGAISASLAEVYDELTEAIPQQKQLGSDDTSIKDNGKKHWIWCITAATFSVFHIAASRSRKVLEKLVGVEFSGYLTDLPRRIGRNTLQ